MFTRDRLVMGRQRWCGVSEAAGWALLVAVLGCSGPYEAPAGAPEATNLEPAGTPPQTGAAGGSATGPAEMQAVGSTAPGAGEGNPGVIVNGTAPPPMANGTPASGSGLLLGDNCMAVCVDASSDADAMGITDGYGFEQGRSCLVPGSSVALTATPCELPAAPAAAVPEVIPGPGFLIAGTCVNPCSDATTDVDAAGVSDGYGFEQGQSCIVPGSPPALQGIPCVPGPSASEGDGFLVDALCVPACNVPRLADAQGYGFEAQQTCVVEGSVAERQAARCAILPREGLPEPGSGFQLTEGCFAACVNAAGVDATGFGFEQERPCVQSGSDAAVQGVPCIPPPAAVTGFCPNPIQCPVANGVTLACGCGFRQGFAERKQVIMNTPGATQYFLASAMMETTTLTSAYPLGDVFPNGVNKTGDAFNGGIAKQNWGMMRRCHPAWAALGGDAFLTGAQLNDNLALDIQVYNECRQRFGNDWWSGHRLGFNALGNNGADVQRFRAAADWTNEMLTGHLADDVFFFVVVPAI